MKINNKEYRIIEKIYEDGHKEYKAQEAINFILFKWWRDFIVDVWEYGYATVNFICCGHTYEDCLEHLKESIQKHEEIRKKNTLSLINIYK